MSKGSDAVERAKINIEEKVYEENRAADRTTQDDLPRGSRCSNVSLALLTR